MSGEHRAFWARIGASSLVVNGPLAFSVASGTISLAVGLVVSGLLGAATLLIWDGSRVSTAPPANDQPVPAGLGEVRQTRPPVRADH